MERGEVWWAQVDEKRPVVLLSGGAGPDHRAVEIVPPATAAQKRGFVVMSGEEALNAEQRLRLTNAADPAIRAIGIEVRIGKAEGLPEDGVVRVALPQDGAIFCTWMVTISQEHLIERLGALSTEKLRELDNAILLAEAL
jgi:mRNA interferase MazF